MTIDWQQMARNMRVVAEMARMSAGQVVAQADTISDYADLIDGYAGDPPARRLWNWSQRDPIYRNEIFAGYLRFETDGCYVCSVSDIVTLAGYEDNPVEVARKLNLHHCFDGALLTHPERIPHAYPLLEYGGTHRWHHGDADMDVVWSELERGPVIAEVDFQWRTQALNQHFVALVEPTTDRLDAWIHDPWDGSVVRLLQKYAWESWDLARAIYGLRLLRIKGGD
jgi:hypothetical protein